MLIPLMHTFVILTVASRSCHSRIYHPVLLHIIYTHLPVQYATLAIQQPIENGNEPRNNSDPSCASDETLVNVRHSGRVRKVPNRYGY